MSLDTFLPALKEALRYDPISGEWTWLKPTGYRAKAGAVAGDLKPSGYIFIGFMGNRYRAHRLAWLYMTGEWPPSQVDHRDTNRANNAWNNLRLASNQQNQANSRCSKNNTSGFKGVFWCKQKQGWVAKINVNRRQIHGGVFQTPELASAKYEEMAKEHFGEFARK